MAAKYYIYRNLHKDCFSIRLRGRIVAYETDLECFNAELRVSQKGRDNVLKTRQKNVHAYIVCDSYKAVTPTDCSGMTEITYNPYLYDSFVEKATGAPVFSADSIKLIECRFIYM